MAEGDSSHSPSLLKRLIKGTALYSLVLFVQRAASLILLPINTRFLSRADYGTLDLLEQIGTVVSVLTGLSISSALGYFYFKEESTEGRGKVVSTVLGGATVLAAGAGILGAVFAGPISSLVFGGPGYRGYVLFVFLTLPLGAVLEGLFSWIRVTDQSGTYTLVSLLRIGITIVMTAVLLAVFKLRIIGVLTSSAVAVVIPGLYLAVYFLRRVRFVFDRRIFVAVFRFSYPMGIASIAMFVMNFGDRFVLRYYRSLTEVGIYAVGYKFGMLIGMIHGAFHTYWYSQVYDVARRADAESVIARIFTYMMLVLSLVLVALIVACKPAIAILVTRPGFEQAAVIAPLIAVAYYVRAIGDFFRCFLLVEGHSGYDAVCLWIGAAVCLIGYFVLIPPFGMWGAGIATLLTFVVTGAVAVAWAGRLRPLRVEGGRLFKIGGTSAALVTLYYLVPVRGVVGQIGWGVLIIAAMPAALWMLRFASPDEIGKLRSLIGLAKDRTRGLLRG